MQKDFAGLVELLEDQLLIFAVDPDSCILNGDLDFGWGVSIDLAPTDGDLPSIRCVLDGVANHMIKDLIQQVFVPTNEGQLGQPRSHQRNLAFLQRRLKYVPYLLDHRLELYV